MTIISILITQRAGMYRMYGMTRAHGAACSDNQGSSYWQERRVAIIRALIFDSP